VGQKRGLLHVTVLKSFLRRRNVRAVKWSDDYQMKQQSAATSYLSHAREDGTTLGSFLTLGSALQEMKAHLTVPIVTTISHDQDATPRMQDHTTDSCAQLLHFAQEPLVSS
jgi:hypothetical protein